MFGVIRTSLALMVMVFHLFSGLFPLGPYAVYGFFIISGFLMTYVMHETYGYTKKGRYSFAVNRALRIYPQYWAAAALSVALIALIGSASVRSYHGAIYFPDSMFSYINNFVIVFQSWIPSGSLPRLVPAAWTLTTEIFFYVLICIGISQSYYRVKVWLILSICYVIWTYVNGFPFVERYAPIAAASLPFSMGSAIYFVKESAKLKNLFLRLRITSRKMFLLFLLNCFMWNMLPGAGGNTVLTEIGFYANILIFSLLVFGVAIGNDILKISKALDDAIGNLSYPIYVLHAQVGVFVSLYILNKFAYEVAPKSFISLIVSVITVLLVSIIFIVLIDRPVQAVRNKFKKKVIKDRTSGVAGTV